MQHRSYFRILAKWTIPALLLVTLLSILSIEWGCPGPQSQLAHKTQEGQATWNFLQCEHCGKNVSFAEAHKNFLYLNFDSPLATRTIRLPMPGESQETGQSLNKYSKFRCSGDEKSLDGYVERLCIFENICVDRESGEFNFYMRNDTPPRPIMFDSRQGEISKFSHDPRGFVAVTQLAWAESPWAGDHKFTPHIVYGESPAISSPNSTLRASNLHALWTTWAFDDNLGHVLWEEIASIWYAMIRMNVLSENVTAMHWPGTLPQRPLARKFRDAFFPAISSTPPVSFYPYLDELGGGPPPTGVRYVCFDELLVGGNVRRFLQRMEWHNYAHEPLFFSLRGRILESFGLDPYFIPSAHQIVIVNKTSSNYHSGERYQTHRSIYNIDEVVGQIRSKYPHTRVHVVDFKDNSIKEQLSLLLSTTLLVTPAGGISMVLPFLPDGANAIILDYLEKEDDWVFGTKAGESVSMEAPFWNYWPHVKKLYYQVRSKDELRPDDPTKSLDDVSWRDETSVEVGLTRLEALLELAFENMSA